MVQKVISTNTFGVAKFVVSSDATQGTHTTIQAAINDATTGDSILVRAGSYNENLTLKAGVTLFTGLSQATPNIGQGGVVLTQGCTLPLTGQVVFQGFYFNYGATNNMFVDQVGGAPSLWMFDCGCNFSANNTVFKCDNGQTNIRLYNFLGTGSSQFYSIASGGTFQCYNSQVQAPGSSPTASSAPSGSTVYYFDSKIGFPTNLTAATFACSNCYFFTSASGFPTGLATIANNTLITTATSGTYEFKDCQFSSGSASAISVGSGTTVKLSGCCDINSSNTNAITGAGTLIGSNINFSGTSSFTNVTSQTLGAIPGIKSVAPAAGMIGEQVRSFINQASGVTLTSGAFANVTSISLTPGVWDICGTVLTELTGAGTLTSSNCSVSTTSATPGTLGDNLVTGSGAVFSASAGTATVPRWRQVLTSTTTVYLIAGTTFTGTAKAYGLLTAVRAG